MTQSYYGECPYGLYKSQEDIYIFTEHPLLTSWALVTGKVQGKAGAITGNLTHQLANSATIAGAGLGYIVPYKKRV